MASLSKFIGPLGREARGPVYHQLQRALRAAIDRALADFTVYRSQACCCGGACDLAPGAPC